MAEMISDDFTEYTLREAIINNDFEYIRRKSFKFPYEVKGLVHLAVAYKSTETLSVLLEIFCSAISLNEELKRPIQVAVENKNIEAVTLLLAHGASLSQITKGGDSMLHIAVRNNFILSLEECITSEMVNIVDIVNELGETPLFFSVKHNKLSALLLLLKVGANPNIPNNKGIKPFSLALKHNNKKLMRVLAKRGADINYLVGGESTELHLAAAEDNYKIVVTLMKLEADMEVVDALGNLPLHVATGRSLKLLLSISDDVNVQGCSCISNKSLTCNVTPLIMAVLRGSKEDVMSVLDCCTINTSNRDKYLRYPFVIAAGKGMIDIIKILIDVGAGYDMLYYVAITEATKIRQFEVVEFLLKQIKEPFPTQLYRKIIQISSDYEAQIEALFKRYLL